MWRRLRGLHGGSLLQEAIVNCSEGQDGQEIEEEL